MQTIRVRTTQNVFIDYPLASIGDRIVAYLIDRLILFLYFALVIALMVGSKAFENEALLVTLLLIFIVFPMMFYSLFFEIFMNGQTPGKRLAGLRVIRLDGKPLGWWIAFERFGGYAASFSVGLLGFAQILWDRNRQGLHDKACETVVIREAAT